MRKSSWVWLLSLALLISFSGLALADGVVKEVEGPKQPVKAAEKGLLWVSGGPVVVERTNLDEVVEYLNETFDEGIPATWTVNDNAGDGSVWTSLSSVNYGSGAAFITATPPFAGCDSDAAGSSADQDTDLITPEIVIPANAYTECWLEFDGSFRNLTGESTTISYTIDGGSNWVELYTLGSGTNYNSHYYDLLPIVGTAGATIQFKWNYVASYGYHNAIDNVKVIGTDEDIRPPVISSVSTPSGGEVWQGEDATYVVKVNDDAGIASADLHYHQWDADAGDLMVGGYNGVIPLTTVNLDTMEATLDGETIGYMMGDQIAIWFEATDASDNANVGRLPNVEGSYYALDVIGDDETPNVEPLFLQAYLLEGQDANFEFFITDDSSNVAIATLYYAEFDTTEANFGPVADGISGYISMMPGTDDVYTATIPGTAGFVEGDFVGYYLVVADDWVPANTDTLPSATEGVPDYFLCEVLSEPDVMWDFEADQGDFVSTGDVWEWGNPEGADAGSNYSGVPYPVPARAYSGTNVWATILDTAYVVYSDGYLTTDIAWALDAGAMLRFTHWYHTESYDGHNVQISTDLGETWTVIEPVEGYPDNDVSSLNNQPAFNGYNNAYWQLATFDLSAYEGQMVKFRIRFGSDSSVNRYGAAIDDFMFWGALVPGELDGTVTDATDAPIEGASVTLYIADSEVEVERTVTDEDGYYHMYPLPGTYDIVVRQYGYLNGTAEDIVIAEQTLSTADVTLSEGTETGIMAGTVWGDMDMTMPLQGVVVSVPDEGFGAFTPADGTFDFGEVDHGPYDIVLTSVPTGYMGYHDVYLFDYEITDRTLPLDLYMPEILPPLNVNATVGDAKVELIWDAPADFFTEEEFEAMPEVLENLHAQYEFIMEEGTDEERAKLQTVREEIFRMEQALLRHNNTSLDQLSDFAGYYIRLNGDIWNAEPLDANELLIEGLRNGLEYEIEIAADYGYHQNYLVWSDPIYVRPLPVPAYVYDEVTYNWVEIDPANGGPGEIWLDVGDDENTGFVDIGFDFEFYGVTYDQLAACTNGWLSFNDDVTYLGLTLTLPSTDLPNATLAPLNEDMDTEVADDGLAIWKYFDSANNLFYVQYKTKYWLYPEDVYTFQMILDPSDNSITYQYNTATSGWNDNTALVGVENEAGTAATSLPASELADGMALKFYMEGGEMGNFEGMVTDIDGGAPIGMALVKAVSSEGRTYSTSSNEDGEYQLLLLSKDAAPYTVTVRAEGYEDLVVEDLDWGSEDFVEYIDFELTELSPDSPPRVAFVNGEFDDRFEVTLGAPGSLNETAYLVYDDGTMAGVYAWTSTPSTTHLAGTGFTVDGTGVILLSAEVHCGIDADDWPDATHQDVVFNILDDDGGMPGEILWSSDPMPVDAVTEWATVTPNIAVPSHFYVMMSNPTPTEGQEGISVDSANDYANYWYNSGSGWTHLTTASGDPLMRATVQYVPGGGETTEAVLDPSRLASGKNNANTLTSSALRSEIWGIHEVRNVTRPHVELPAATTSLDEVGDVMWYMLQYSLDGTAWTTVAVDGDTLFAPDNSVIPVILGSDEENVEYMYRAGAWMTDPDGVLDSLQTQWAEGTATFNMMPANPTDIVADVDGTNITLTVTAPTTNADGTDLVDLEGYTAWDVTGDTPVEVGTSTTSEISFSVTETGIYSFTVTAYDEVPNTSAPATPILLMAGTPGVETSFEDGEWNSFATDGVWEHGDPTAGPGAAFEGTNVWATVVGGNYDNSQNNMLWTVEPLTVTDDDALMIYYHWYDYESGWDGYNVMASADDGDSWNLVVPVGGYPDADVDGIGDEIPGFSASTGGWQMVLIPLGDYVGENISIAFNHGTDGSVNTYYGVAIDNLALYGVELPVYGSITGMVKECNTDGAGINNVEIWAEGWPVALGTTASGAFDVELPVGTRDIMFVHDDYWTLVVEDVVVTEDTPNDLGELYMTYPEGYTAISSMEMEYRLDLGEVVTGNTFDVENIGCGPMEYAVSIQILDNVTNETPGGELPTRRENVPAEAFAMTSGESVGPLVGSNLDDTWDLIQSYTDIETGTGAQDNYGWGMGATEFYVGGFYYGTLTTFSYDGTYLTQVPIDGSMQGSSITGIFGLSNDPDGYLYGGNDTGEIFKFLPDMSEVVSQGSIPLRAISVAYDYDNNMFYASDFSSGFYKLAPNGTAQSITMPTSGAIYGLAYVPMDPDGYTIYAHVETNPTSVIRYDPTQGTWDETPVATVYTLVNPDVQNGDSCGDMAAGLRGDTYDFLTAMQGGSEGTGYDLGDLWEGYTLQQWITIAPAEGTILPGATQQFTITVDPTADESFDPQQGETTDVFISLSGPHMDEFGVFVEISWTTGADEETQLPTEYALHQNYPNPFNPSTSIKFALVEAQPVKLTVYNMLGQEVTRLVNTRMEAGYHTVNFDASRLASGVYFYRLETPAYTNMKKMVMIK